MENLSVTSSKRSIGVQCIDNWFKIDNGQYSRCVDKSTQYSDEICENVSIMVNGGNLVI